MLMPPQNAFYAQSGGVTAVINASAAGVMETARQHTGQIGKVHAGRHGILGALTEELIDTSQESAATIVQLTHTPGGDGSTCGLAHGGLRARRYTGRRGSSSPAVPRDPL
jgi:ATP-dependent phosphofructokinase / diphosphate-dependent phosphofructokinase